MDATQQLAELRREVKLAAAWYAMSRDQPGWDRLRALPDMLQDGCYGWLNTIEPLHEAFRSIVTERAERVQDVAPAVSTGRLLWHMPVWSFADGLMEGQSSIFDVCDLPGWDTWVAVEPVERDSVLYSWIPARREQEVTGAMWTNAVPCVGWCDDPCEHAEDRPDTPLMRLLRDGGLGEK